MKFNSLNIGPLFGRCNNIFHRPTRFLKRGLAVKKSERNETYRSNKHQRPRPHNRPRILNKIFIFRSAGRLFPLFFVQVPSFNERQPEVPPLPSSPHWQIFARFNFTWPDLDALQNEKDEQKTFNLLVTNLSSCI